MKRYERAFFTTEPYPAILQSGLGSDGFPFERKLSFNLFVRYREVHYEIIERSDHPCPEGR